MNINKYKLYEEKYLIPSDNSTPYKIKKDGTLTEVSTYAKGMPGYKYKTIAINGTREYLHRVVYKVFNGRIKEGMNVDHINGDRNDNRAENLQLLTPSMNSSKTMNDNRDKEKIDNRIKIICNETGVVYNSMSEAAQWILKISDRTSLHSVRSSISNHIAKKPLKGYIIKHVNGYTFKKV